MSEDSLCVAAGAASQWGPAAASGRPGPDCGAGALSAPASPGGSGSPTFDANLRAIQQFLASL